MKHVTATILLLAGILLLTGCSAESGDAQEPRQAAVGTLAAADTGTDAILYSATDALGRSVTLSGRPERIVIAGKATLLAADILALFDGVTENLAALGVTDQGLGDFFPLLLSGDGTVRLPKSASAEEIAALQPDIVFMKESNYPTLGSQLEKLEIPVFNLYLENPESYQEEVLTLGELLHQEERAATVAAFYRDRTEEISTAAAALDPGSRRRVLLLYATTTDGVSSFQVPPASWIQSYMVETAGGIPVWTDETFNTWKLVSFEQISAWDPEVIYIVTYRDSAEGYLEQIAASDLWQELPAFVSGNIRAFPADFHSWAQPDSRWILGMRWIAHDLYPELFADTAVEDELALFYGTLYGVNDDNLMDDILRRYRGSLHTVADFQ
mgnify:CR=1 FL=1